MAKPNSTTPLLIRIEEMFVSGSGATNYNIPTGSYSLDWYYDGRTPEELSRDVLVTPQINWSITTDVSENGWYRPNDEVLYDVNLEITVARKLTGKLLKANRFATKAAFNYDFHLIEKALGYTGNLDSTSNGVETGLCSGMFTEGKQEKPTIDHENELIYGTFSFKGWVVLSNSGSSPT